MAVQWQGPRWLEGPADACGIRWLDRTVWMELRGPEWDDKAVSRCCELRHLKTLVLYDTHISEDGVARIRTALPACEIRHSSLPAVKENAVRVEATSLAATS